MIREHGAHLTTAGEAAGGLGDGGRVVGRRSGLSELVPTILLASEGKGQAHQLLAKKRNRKRLCTRRITF